MNSSGCPPTRQPLFRARGFVEREAFFEREASSSASVDASTRRRSASAPMRPTSPWSFSGQRNRRVARDELGIPGGLGTAISRLSTIGAVRCAAPAFPGSRRAREKSAALPARRGRQRTPAARRGTPAARRESAGGARRERRRRGGTRRRRGGNAGGAEGNARRRPGSRKRRRVAQNQRWEAEGEGREAREDRREPPDRRWERSARRWERSFPRWERSFPRWDRSARRWDRSARRSGPHSGGGNQNLAEGTGRPSEGTAFLRREPGDPRRVPRPPRRVGTSSRRGASLPPRHFAKSRPVYLDSRRRNASPCAGTASPPWICRLPPWVCRLPPWVCRLPPRGPPDPPRGPPDPPPEREILHRNESAPAATTDRCAFREVSLSGFLVTLQRRGRILRRSRENLRGRGRGTGRSSAGTRGSSAGTGRSSAGTPDPPPEREHPPWVGGQARRGARLPAFVRGKAWRKRSKAPRGRRLPPPEGPKGTKHGCAGGADRPWDRRGDLPVAPAQGAQFWGDRQVAPTPPGGIFRAEQARLPTADPSDGGCGKCRRRRSSRRSRLRQPPLGTWPPGRSSRPPRRAEGSSRAVAPCLPSCQSAGFGDSAQ